MPREIAPTYQTEYMSPNEIARRLQVTSGYIRKLIKMKKIKALKIGTIYRIKISDYHEFLKSIIVHRE